MKKLFTICALFAIAFTVNAQPITRNKVEDSVNSKFAKENQHIPISYNGNKLFSSEKQKPSAYDRKSYYKSYSLTEFANALQTYLDIPSAANVSQEISDSLSTISGGGFFVDATATAETTHDADSNSFSLLNVDDFLVESITETRVKSDTKTVIQHQGATEETEINLSATGALISSTVGITIGSDDFLKFTSIPTHADDTAAGAAGLTAGMLYKTGTGVLMIKL